MLRFFGGINDLSSARSRVNVATSRKLQKFVGAYLLSANPICTRTCSLHWHRCCAELDRSEKRYRQNHGDSPDGRERPCAEHAGA